MADYQAFGLKIRAPAGLALSPVSLADAERPVDLIFRVDQRNAATGQDASNAVAPSLTTKPSLDGELQKKQESAVAELHAGSTRRLLHDVEDFPGGPRLRVWAEDGRYRVEYQQWQVLFEPGGRDIFLSSVADFHRRSVNKTVMPDKIAKMTEKRSQHDQFRFVLTMERVFLPLYLLLSNPGQLGLHGSAVEFGGRAYLFIGRSGAGKSTTAYEFVRRGGRLLADDLIMVDPDAGVAFGGVPTLRLWKQQGAVKEAIDDRGIWQMEGSKRWFRMPQELGATGGAPIGAVILLDPDELAEPTIAGTLEQPSRRQTLVELLSQTFDLSAPHEPWAVARFKNASKLTRDYPCYRFYYRKSADGRPAHVDALFEAISSLSSE